MEFSSWRLDVKKGTHVALENTGPSFSKLELPVFPRLCFTTPFVSKKYLCFLISVPKLPFIEEVSPKTYTTSLSFENEGPV